MTATDATTSDGAATSGGQAVSGGAATSGGVAVSGAAAAEPAVRIDAVRKVHGRGAGAVLALDDITLDVAPGEFVCVVGASGCGKSTLLSLVAGLDAPTAGTVAVPGWPALMFQEPALYPWLTVAGNVELPLRLAGVGRAERRERARELLASVHLAEFAQRRPHQLSGGMRQRVALARTLALERPVLLMDEPFGALDAMTRDLLHDELETLWQQRRPAVLFVTHNVREAARLGDRIVLLASRPGRVVWQTGVDAPRPRRMDSAATAAVAAEVTDRLREQVRRHGR